MVQKKISRKILKENSKTDAIPKNYPLKYVHIAITDIDGILRGKMMEVEKFNSAAQNGFGFCDVVFGWDMGDIAYDNISYTGWHTGYPDAQAFPDLSTKRAIPCLENSLFFMADFKEPVPCPRRLLKNIQKQAKELGYLPLFSQEFEWFNFKRQNQSNPDSGIKWQTPLPITPGMFGYSILRLGENQEFWNTLFHVFVQAGIPVEGLHTETGPGVAEAAIKYADVLEAADRAVLFKTLTKIIGYRFGIQPSFMAKWNENLPGCSGHLHQSLAALNSGENLFFDSRNKGKISNLMRNYIAGQLYCLPEILPMYAPNVNSYKRLTEGAWAPTTITWGFDNRTTALRVIADKPSSTRLETRVPGSDVNPYLAMAAALASGLYGIKNKLSLTIEPTRGNGYQDQSQGRLAPNLWEATQKMKHSSIAKELFGNEFVQHFTATRETEWKRFMRSVTDWELQRYFEII